MEFQKVKIEIGDLVSYELDDEIICESVEEIHEKQDGRYYLLNSGILIGAPELISFFKETSLSSIDLFERKLQKD